MKQDHTSRLDEFIDRPKRAIWVLAGPMMMGFAVHAVYSFVDMIFIGQLGPMALAGSTFVMPLFFVAIALGVGFATGVTANVAQAIGRRDREEADHFASNSLGLGLLIGVLFAVCGLTMGKWIMPVLGAEGESAEFAWQYFEILSAGMPLMFVSMSIRAVLTGEGDAKTPMIVLTIATLLNLSLDPLFIFVLDMGIRGAALATLTSQLFSLITFSYIAFVRKSSFVRFRLSLLRPSSRLLVPILRIGLPTAAGQLVMALGSGLLNRVLASFGQIAVAGYGAGSRMDLIVALPMIGLASASVSVIGMFAGAGRADLVRSMALYTYRWVISLATVVGLCAYLASQWVVGWFTAEPQAIEIGRTYLGYMVFAYPLMGIGMTSGRVLQGLGYGVPSLIITALRVLIVGVPGAYIAVYCFGAPIESAWISIIAGGFLANVLAIIWVRKYIWKSDPTVRATKSDTL
ncbi:MAG: MATE family efflux transporter [Deltaproteobacteria bacterium]|nr:MATE family efflux transporter [Deltaproteobacteria bacterium]